MGAPWVSLISYQGLAKTALNIYSLGYEKLRRPYKNKRNRREFEEIMKKIDFSEYEINNS